MDYCPAEDIHEMVGLEDLGKWGKYVLTDLQVEYEDRATAAGGEGLGEGS